MKTKFSFSKRILALLLSVLMLLTSGILSAVAVTVDIAETSANTTASDGSYRLYFKFSGGSTWWNGTGCYHYAWVWGTNMTDQWCPIYKVGTTSTASTGSTTDVFYMNVPSGTLTGMKLIRSESDSGDWNGYYNATGDISIPNNISTYNLITAVTANSTSVTQNSRYTSVEVSSSGATVTNALGGSGTSSDPYQVTAGQVMNVSATSSIADHNFKVGYGYNSSTQYTTTSTGTVTASTDSSSVKSFNVYYTPLLNGSTSYRGTQSSKTIYYKVQQSVVAPDTPEAPQVVFNNTFGGTGTQADPYLVEAGKNTNMTVTGTLGDAEGLAYNVNYPASPVDFQTSVTYTGVTAPAVGTTSAVNTYLWAYNGSGTSKEYSDEYATKTVYIKGVYTVVFNFKDYNGDQIDDTVIYDGSAYSAPNVPDRDGYNFKGWTRPNDSTVYKSSELPTLTGNTVFTAFYDVKTHDVTLILTETGGNGTVTASPYTITNNIVKVQDGDEVTFKIEAPPGYYISSFNGVANTNQGKTYDSVTLTNVTADQDVTVNVTYAIKTVYPITVTNMNTEAGTYTIDINSGTYGEEFTIDATATGDYVFKSFTVNGIEYTTNPLTMAITREMEITVNWAEQSWQGIIFVEQRGSWSSTYAYTFCDTTGHHPNGEWPGTAMTNIGTSESGYPIYAIRVPVDSATFNSNTYEVVFNNGSGAQTADLAMSSKVNYYIINGTSVIDDDGYEDISVELPVKIYLDYGASKHYQVSGAKTNITIGHTSVDVNEDSVIDMSERKRCSQHDNNYYDPGYATANVYEGQPVTITTTIQSDATEYMVEGFVINAKEFVPANYMGNGKYSATYSFTEEGTVVVPIYSYTDTFLEAEGLTEITLYAQIPDDFEGNWGDYMAAYVWYDNPGDNTTTDYIFGAWPGQIMIPVEGTENYWYTTVTSKSANDYPASGITFSNYGGWESTTGVLYPVTNTTNIQVYDYYEFITLAQQEVDNITFVLKNGADNNAPTSNTTINDSDFVDYVNISGDTIDVYGKKIPANSNIGLYVIRNAPVSSNVSPLSGNYYVECSLYQSNGTYIGNCFSYELLDIDALADKLGNSYLKTLADKRVRVDYETLTHQANVDGNAADRYDGQWYNAVVEVNLSVNVAETTNDGANYTVTYNSPANSDTYGSATVGGGAVTTVDRGNTVTLSAVPAPGYKFIGWYYAGTNTKFATSTTTTVQAVIDASYTAVFQELGEGEFVVTHEIYKGGGSSAYIPEAHGGRADLYIGIVNDTTHEIFDFKKTGMASVSATEGDELIITIGTDPLGVDKFFSWYIDAVDKYGLTTYEEVGVDNYGHEGSGEYGNLYDNGEGTLEGRTDLVRFQFKYTVKKDLFNLALYSDVVPTNANAKLVYKYENRYGEVKSVTVPYILTNDEIDGITSYQNKPMTPSMETIYKNAPYIEDLYKDSTWVITDALYNNTLFELWATQPDTIYTVTVNAGGSISYLSGKFNAETEIDGKTLNPALSKTGFWYIDTKHNWSYDENEDVILSYGLYYALRITDNMWIAYEEVDELKFDIVIDAPEYGREQNTDSSGGNKTDFIYIDYMTSIFVPFFKFDRLEDGTRINEVTYQGQVIPSTNSSVTIETLDNLGYDFDYGLILEQLNPNVAGNIDTNYGKVAADESTLIKVVEGANGFVDNIDKSKYYTLNSAVGNYPLTNKNRLLFTIVMNNTEGNRAKYFNVYGYLKVTDTQDNTTYYFSDMQTLNIKDIGENLGTDQAPDYEP